MKTISRWARVAGIAMLLGGAGTTACAQFQPTLQGQLRTDSGQALTGTVDLRLSLHTAPTGGTPLQQFVQNGVAVSGGVFSLKLPFDLWKYGNASGLYVGIEVKNPSNSWVELTPRQPLGAAPVALTLPGVTISSDEVVNVNISVSAGNNAVVRQGGWQSFTCTASGELRAVLPALSNLGTGLVTGTVNIRPGEGMTNPPIATTTFTILPNSSVGKIILPTAVAISAGDVYTVEVEPYPNNNLVWYGAYGDVYSGGTSGASTPPIAFNYDRAMQTLVTSHNGARNYFFGGDVRAYNLFTEGTVSMGTASVNELTADVASVTGVLTAGGAVINGPVSATDAIVGGKVGIGATLPTAQLQVRSPSVPSGFQVHLTNDAVANANFRTSGLRVSDAGFFEVSNSISGPNFARLSSTGVWTAVSDARLKSDVARADGLLDAALKLRPVTFRWNADGLRDTGLIAQEVRDVLPSFVLGDESREMLTVDYPHLSVVAIGAVQELEARVATLERENRRLREQVARIDAALQSIARTQQLK
ncbi:MAG: tail fiber domain-containing protein [Phycisphaerales bacterium]|nr:tail fiber domain-containing protein [Planctomycetota bacterium]